MSIIRVENIEIAKFQLIVINTKHSIIYSNSIIYDILNFHDTKLMVLLLVSMNTYLFLELRNLLGWRNILHSLSYNRIVVPRISIDISDRIQTRNRITFRTSFEFGFRQTKTISIWSPVSWSYKLNKYSFIEIFWILKI